MNRHITLSIKDWQNLAIVRGKRRKEDAVSQSPSFIHSVTLDAEKCRGCTNCIKRCPTEAIRVRGGKAQITESLCIDCGECIRICPYKAKKPIFDKLEDINRFKYKVAPVSYTHLRTDRVRSARQLYNQLRRRYTEACWCCKQYWTAWVGAGGRTGPGDGEALCALFPFKGWYL